MFSLMVLLSGCTSSKLVLSPIYNRLDNRMMASFEGLHEFTDAQHAAVEERVRAFHDWHRQVELPRYAELLHEAALAIRDDAVNDDDMRRWFHAAHELSARFGSCHPANFSASVVQSLDTSQLEGIRTTFNQRIRRALVRHAEESPTEKTARRLATFDKWTRRIQLDLEPDQLDRVRDMLDRQIGLGREYYLLAQAWLIEMYRLAALPDTAENTALIEAHFHRFWTLLETHHPADWQTNLALWQETATELEASFTPTQRSRFSDWLLQFAATLGDIADDEIDSAIAARGAIACRA